MEVKIKRAGIEDVAVVAALFDAYRIFYDQESDVLAANNFIAERLLKNESVIFIAVMNETAVGFIQLYPIFSSVSLSKAWLLNDLYVAKNARQQGVAAALLAKAKLFGEEQKAKWLLLETAADNFKAQSVYEKNGWVKQTDFFYQLPLFS